MTRLYTPHRRPRLARCVARAVTLLLLFAPEASAQSRDVRSVLVLFGNRTTALSAAEMEPVFRRELEGGLGAAVDLHVEYLDIVEGIGDAYERRLVELLAQKYIARRFDLILAVRPESLSFVLGHRDALFAGVPVVFVDMLQEALRGVQLPPDVTGIMQPPVASQGTVSVALDLHPAARRAVILGGASGFDRDREVGVRQLIRARAPDLEVVSLIGQPLDDQLRAVSALSADSVVFFTSYRADSLGRSMVAADVLRLVAGASSAPLYGASQSWLGLGIVGGDLIRYDTLAQRAAELANRILRGEAPWSIPPAVVPVSELMFDWRQLQRWGIDERRLPAGSVVMFRVPTIFETYRWYVLGFLGVALAQSLLLGALLVERRTRRLAQIKVLDAEQRYRTIADFNHDWESWMRPDGTYAYVSPSAKRLTGYEAQAFFDNPALTTDLVVPEDRPRWAEHTHTSIAGQHPAGLEFRIKTASGEIRWIDHVCSPVVENGQFLGVRGSNRDITERKRAELDLRKALAEIEHLRDRLEVDNTYLSEELKLREGIEGIVGASDALGYVLGKARQVAETSSTVLLMGETGVGKDMVAAAIHNLSGRRARPLIKVNCAALPPSLIESELFGHEKGAFTGAATQRKGRFEIAHGTTLFLDEVGELPLELQAKLLRVLQDGEFERVGGNVTLKADVRIIAATNRNLIEEVKAGRFREDVWYRLNVFPITLPPLRQRRDDIPLLVRHFIEKHCRRMGRAPLEVTRATLQDLQSREWVGNVRELESVVERAVIISRGSTLKLGDDAGGGETSVESGPGSHGGVKTLDQAEREHIVATLDRTGGRLEGEGGAATLLGINPSTLRSRMLKLGIRRPSKSADVAAPPAPRL
jgi:PAS domain S-box-containing protein